MRRTCIVKCSDCANWYPFRAGFNNIDYKDPEDPTLYTVLNAGKDVEKLATYDNNTNPFIVKQGDLVEIVVNNYDSGAHIMHIHGHQPQLIARADGIYAPPPDPKSRKQKPDGKNKDEKGAWDDSKPKKLTPMRRDSWFIAPLGYTVVRFVADNPGVWLIHCHMEWHVTAGLTATLIEAPKQLQQQSMPSAQRAICKK